eukprot:scaffold26173_cov117-Cylindrotheca_fusiformis.AAC.1
MVPGKPARSCASTEYDEVQEASLCSQMGLSREKNLYTIIISQSFFSVKWYVSPWVGGPGIYR